MAGRSGAGGFALPIADSLTAGAGSEGLAVGGSAGLAAGGGNEGLVAGVVGVAVGGWDSGSPAGGESVHAALAAASSATAAARCDWLVRADRLKCRVARASGRIAASTNHSRIEIMWVIALEALVALCLLGLIVWLTMGSPRRRDAEPPPRLEHDADKDDKRP